MLLPAMGQKIVYLRSNDVSLSDADFFGGNVVLFRGNMVVYDKYLKFNKNIHGKYEVIYNDEINSIKYIFFYSPEHPTGWLLKDKQRHRYVYIDREFVVVVNFDNNSVIYRNDKNCGFDILLYPWNCGFSDAYYNFSEGYLFFKKHRMFLRDKYFLLDVLSGEIKSIHSNGCGKSKKYMSGFLFGRK